MKERTLSDCRTVSKKLLCTGACAAPVPMVPSVADSQP
jgi:hypothetical protein